MFKAEVVESFLRYFSKPNQAPPFEGVVLNLSN